MPSLKKILAICGSTRENSTNLKFINAIIHLTEGRWQVTVYKELAALPHFNPDLDSIPENTSTTVLNFRKRIRESDGILICTPEYAMGVPGTLKNAIDWTVSSGDFSHKPVALITASSSGKKAHQSLLETLKVIEAEIDTDTETVISFAQTKINDQCIITDTETKLIIENLIVSLTKKTEAAH